MRIVPRPLAHPVRAVLPPSALGLALAVALATGPCAAGPEQQPAAGDPAPMADTTPDAAEPGATARPEATAATGDPAPANASAEAAIAAPKRAERPARRRREPPPPPVIEPRSEWTMDESIATPADLVSQEILAKFRKDDGRFVIIYRRDDGHVIRRLQGSLGAYTLVEEAIVPPEEGNDDSSTEEPEGGTG